MLELLDYAIIGVAAAALLRRICTEGLDPNDCFLWFLVGTAVFLNLGSLRDSREPMVLGRSAAAEEAVHLLELLHIFVVGLTYGFVRGVPAPTRSNLADWTPRLTHVAIIFGLGLFLRLTVFDPREPLRLSESNYVNQLTLLPLACFGVISATAMWHLGARQASLARHVLIYLLLLPTGLLLSFYYSRTPLMYAVFLYGMLVFSTTVARSRRSGVERFSRFLLALAVPGALYLVLTIGSLAKGYSAAHTGNLDRSILVEEMRQHRRSLAFIDAYENALFAYEHFPSQHRYLWGQSFISVASGVIPRSLWPNKPAGFSEPLTIAKRGEKDREAGLSLATSLLGDLWAGGGVANIILGSILVGAAMGQCQRWYEAHRASAAVTIIYWEMCFMWLLCQRGDIYIVFSRGLVILVMTYACLRAAGADVASRLGSEPVQPVSRQPKKHLRRPRKWNLPRVE